MTQKSYRKLLAGLIALIAVCATFTGCEGYFSKTRLDEPEADTTQPDLPPKRRCCAAAIRQ